MMQSKTYFYSTKLKNIARQTINYYSIYTDLLINCYLKEIWAEGASKETNPKRFRAMVKKRQNQVERNKFLFNEKHSRTSPELQRIEPTETKD